MRLQSYLTYGTTEIANASRTFTYISNLGLPIPATFTSCDCPTADENTYTTPESDPAPWYDPDREESADFLGLFAHEARLDPVVVRAVTPKSMLGSVVGPLRPKHRIASVRGLMFARSETAMSYGERWLNDILGGVLTGCSTDSLTVLLACPQSETEIVPWRTLRRVGIVDGPSIGPASQLPECYVSEVTFQLAAGVPYLLHDEASCLDVVISEAGS